MTKCLILLPLFLASFFCLLFPFSCFPLFSSDLISLSVLHSQVRHSSSAYSKFHEISLPLSPLVLLHEEVAQLQEEVHLLRQMKDMLSKDLEETQGGSSTNLLSATELRVQLGDKEQELDRAKEALQGQESTQASCHLTRVPSFQQLQQIYSKYWEVSTFKAHFI